MSVDRGDGSPEPGDEVPADRGPMSAPPAAALEALGPDSWGWLLTHVRRALHDLDAADVTPLVSRLRAAPAGRLAGGRSRSDLIRLLAGGGPAWTAAARRLASLDLPPEVAAALAGQAATAPPGPSATASTSATRDDAATRDDEAERLRRRLRELRGDVAELRRRLAGAEVRAATAEDRVAELEVAVAEARDDLARERRSADEVADDRERAVARERRRGDAAVRARDRELAELRRQLAERDRDAERRRAAREAARPPRPAPDGTPSPASGGRVVPGRPTRLPDGVRPGTREAVELLLHPGRELLVDGYNLTKQHHPELDLAGQRAWLVGLLRGVAARRRVHATAVFDGAGAGSRPAAGGRDVAVRFTPDGVTADDELVLAVEATDDPVLVVTDDRELVGRLRAVGADVVGTREFLWATR